ncbi:variable surface protein [Plasmodium gonderi]|uniref:Variable surface protein n=1 Tax=Plasmodium gonderi TaxID=77519 RepID=A0A1Y1JIH5_PLAGO|nr:variable surface protein [Plasmodium gonderi]GAW82030.1 variable surface protein [Plasmodium gonderi]
MHGLESKEWEDELKGFPSNEKYNNLDRALEGNERKSDCITFEDEDSNIKELCKKMARNLRELGSMPIGENRRERCYYLQHWLYYKTRKMLSLNEYSNRKDYFKNKLRQVAKNINDKELRHAPCECVFYGEFNHWKEEKHMHDYFKDYDYIQCNDADKGMCQTYLDYVTYINKLYEKYYYDEEYDCCFYLDDCKSFFNCDEKYKPEDLLTELKVKIDQLTDAKISEYQDSGHMGQDEYAHSLSRSSMMQRDDDVGSSVNTHDLLDEESTTISSSLGMTDNLLNSNNLHQLLVASSIVGTILFLYFYYRSTSQASRPHRRGIKGKKINIYHNDDIVCELPHHSVENELSDSETSQLHLPY